MRALLVALTLVAVGCGSKKQDPPAGSGSAPTPAVDAGVKAAVGDAAVAALPPDAGASVDPGPGSDAPQPVSDKARGMFVDKIPDQATFEAYSKELGGERFSKFVLDMRTKAIYYFDVNVFPVHKDFIFDQLYKKPKTAAAVKLVNRNYGNSKPDFMMVYLVHHVNIDKWTFAYWPGDDAQPDHIRFAYKRIKETFFNGDKVKFRPDSDKQVLVAKRTKDVPYVLNDELYKAQDYVAFNQGSAVGRLRLVPDGVNETEVTFDPDEIVVLKSQLSDITPVAGIISETFSTPLAHVSLRAKGWGIPNIGLVDAHKKLKELEGKTVYFEAKGTSHVVRAATDAEVAAAKARRDKVAAVVLPASDLEHSELTFLAKMREKDANIFGPKSANLGEIIHAKLAGFDVPAGFGIPFRYYVEHLKAAGIDKTITALLADPAVQKDAALRKTKLEELRAAIEKAPFADELKKKVDLALKALPDNDGVFVRSSTNAEDLPTFSGAGLHDTKPNVKGLDAVCDAIKSVWASTWTLRAYDARAHAKIDQTKVFGSALVQVGVPATAAGVVATVHPTDPTDVRNYTVNAKAGLGLAVVEGRKTPESLIVNWANKGVRVLSRSDEATLLVFDETGGVREVPNPNKGKVVLTNARANHLVGVSRALTQLFKNDKLDIEWVFVKDKLYIVQTRPLVSY